MGPPRWLRAWRSIWHDIRAAPCTPMPDLKGHLASRGAASSLLTNRISKHPERYLEIFRVFRKYELHHIVAELGMSHHHEDEDLEELHHDDEDDAHGAQLACALEEL